MNIAGRERERMKEKIKAREFINFDGIEMEVEEDKRLFCC
jgi:hypothetical protein